IIPRPLFPDRQTQPAQLIPDGHQCGHHLNPVTGRPLPAVHLPDNLPETKQALAEGVTRGIDALYHAGEIKGRQDVIQALTEA
ncbi:hypothetical protein ACSLOE_30550, partial [Escherichia coli]